MANLSTAAFFADISGVTTARTLGQRHADIINVKDFGAVGDGYTNDQAAIQAALDAAFGPQGVGNHSTNPGTFANRTVFFPSGQYNIDTPLNCWNVHAGHLIGCGKKSTVIHYAGSAAPQDDGFTSLIQFNEINYTTIEGMTFNMPTSVSGDTACFRIHDDGSNNDGTTNTFYDVGFTNGDIGTLIGFNSSGSTGSEIAYISCWWENNSTAAMKTNNANALNESIIGGTVKNCGKGFWSAGGAIPNIMGVRFIANSDYDLDNGNASGEMAAGIDSTSPNFCNTNGSRYIAAVYHHASSSGDFIRAFSQGRTVADGCHSTNGLLACPVFDGGFIYLKATTLDNGSAITNYTSGGASAAGHTLYVDDVKVHPP